MEIQAGWYKDETSPGFDRYWDGKWWTAETRESIRTDGSPPSPPRAPAKDSAIASVDVEVASGASEKTFLTMSEAEFAEVVGHLSDRIETHAALFNLWRVESQSLRNEREILAAHAENLGRNLIRPKIQEGISWQKHEVQQAVNALGVAMRNDFEESVRWIGGPALLPVPVDQAWENFNAPVKRVVDAIVEEMQSVLTEVANIEDEYLYI